MNRHEGYKKFGFIQHGTRLPELNGVGKIILKKC
jgi:hypothetical protein